MEIAALKHDGRTNRRSRILPLALCLLLALGLRLLIWAGPLHQLANDEVEYAAVARDLLAGRGWVFYDQHPWLRAPLYNLFLAGSLWLAGGDLHRAALPNLVLSVANVALVYALALRLVGRRAALLAALLMAVLWTNVTFASLYMAETLFTFCFLAGLNGLLRTRQSDRGAGGAMTARLRPYVVSGVLFGLATLTRSATLLFLPVVATWIWLAVSDRAAGGNRHAWWRAAAPWLCAGAFFCTACLTIAPWTARNYVAYGRVIPVETGLAYNLWAFNEPRESLEQINQALSAIPNPAVRSDYATARGLERLREDPAILARKLWPNWVYLARVKPIQDRFVLESYYLDVRLPQFVAALVLDDALYLLIALAGVGGLCLHAPRPTQHAQARLATPQALCVLWLLYSVATIVLTHGEGRYRHFVLPTLIPWAAWVLVQRRASFVPVFRRGWPLLALLAALLLVAFVPSYPFGWAATNLARGWQQQLGKLAHWRGDHSAALAHAARAADIAGTGDAFRRLGDAARRNGDATQAEAAYRESARIEKLWAAPAANLGDLLRAQNRPAEARAAFSAPFVSERELTDWAWHHANPAPTATLDVGNGLDFGYVSGVYDAEPQQGASARWTNGRALLRLQRPARGGLLQLRLAAPHPGDQGALATVCLADDCHTFDVARTWNTYQLPLLPAPASAPIEIRSPTFSSNDGRTLGLLLDAASVETPGSLQPSAR